MDIATVLTRKYPDSLWSCVNNDYSQLDWQSDTPKPTKAELEALWSNVQYETAFEAVEQNRQSAYQKTADPLFFKWQAGSGTAAEWQAERQRIKDEHPYPEPV